MTNYSASFTTKLPMFTGIVEETGVIESFTPAAQSWRLRVRAGLTLQNVALGDSISVNGCCLTVTRFGENFFEFDLLAETRRLTSFSVLEAGAAVNLERSLRFDGKVGGHFVSGHVDGLGLIDVFEQRGKDFYLRIQSPEKMGRYVVKKGSIAIDGISLTVAEVEGDAFAVWLIPHTLSVTNLREKKVGAPVNLEFDLLGKYVEKLATSYFSPAI